jgi:hypothetical protein
MFYYDCNYYLTATTWNSTLTIKKAPTIAELKTATATVVWDGSTDDASRCCNFWAPEIHQLNGPNGLRWYFYRLPRQQFVGRCLRHTSHHAHPTVHLEQRWHAELWCARCDHHGSDRAFGRVGGTKRDQ